MPGFPKPRPPANRIALERWIDQKAQADGVAVNRLRRAVSFMVLSAVLARFVDDEGAPLFLLKGGVAMELRLGMRARASKDYDTAFRDELSRLGGSLPAIIGCHPGRSSRSRWPTRCRSWVRARSTSRSTLASCDPRTST
jgi:hypothetical protein